MVNPGHPSRGCHACRRRRVKCDEARPQCNRCTRTGNTCPGYRNLNDLRFKFVGGPRSSSTQKQESGHDRQIKQLIADALTNPEFFSSESEDLPMSRQSTISPPNSSPTTSTELLVPRPLSTPWEPLALPLFINLFTSPGAIIEHQGLMSSLPAFYSQTTSESPLHLAVSAASDANAAKKLTDTSVLYRARQKHLTALRAVQRALQDPIKAREDSTLCSLFVLTVYEYIIGDATSPLGSHISGYEALLDLRSRDIEDGSMNYSLFLDVATQIVINHLRLRTAPKPRTVEILQNLTRDDPGTRVVKLNVRVSVFNHEALKIIAELSDRQNIIDTGTYETLWNVVHLGEQLDEEITPWPGSDDTDIWDSNNNMAYTICNTPLEDWTGHFHMYTNLWTAFHWNMYRCARIMLLTVVLQACRTLMELGHQADLIMPSLESANTKIRALLADVVASFPYCLGKGDAKFDLPTRGIATSGFAMIWPAGLTMRCPLSTPEQRAKAFASIAYVGQALGLQRASQLGDLWSRGVVL